MDFINNAAPSVQRRFAMKERNVRLIA
jgi:hypothetical protein